MARNPVIFVVDTETTGLGKDAHLCEIALLPVSSDFKPLRMNPFNTLVNPGVDAYKNKYRETFQINKINPYDVMDAPSVEEVSRMIEGYLTAFGDNIVISPIAQQWNFDYKVLSDAFSPEWVDKYFDRTVRDTKVIATLINDICQEQWGFQPFPRVNLDYLCSYYKITNKNAHRALSDCNATLEVFLKLKETAKNIPRERPYGPLEENDNA